MKKAFLRFARGILPVLAIAGTEWGRELLGSHPIGALLVIPALGAAGKGIRELWPGKPVARYWPF